MHAFRLSVALCCLALLVSLPSCSDEKNPYKDAAKSDVSVVCAALASDSTTEIFSVDTFSVQLLLQAHIDSFTLHADSNKMWRSSDTTVRKPSFGVAWSFPFLVEFIDTGWKSIRATAYRDNGSSVSDSMRVHVKSPLHQPDVEGEAGAYITLQTPPVKDPYVFYVWKFGTDSVVNDQPQATKLLAEGFTFAAGQLYVRGLSAGYQSVRSPSNPFKVTLADTKAPAITCLSSGLQADSQHIVTGNIPYYFRVRAQDQATSIADLHASIRQPDSCSIIDPKTWECTWVLLSLPPTGDSLVIVVYAADQRGNPAVDTFCIHYNDSAVSRPTIAIQEPPQDDQRVPSRDMTIRGDINDIVGHDSLRLYLSVDGIPQPGRAVVEAGASAWSFAVRLGKPTLDTSRLGLYLVDSGSVVETLDVAYRTVIYDSLMSDITPPYIARITTNGATLIDGYYAAQSPLPVTASVYDQGGVDTVKVNAVVALSLGGDDYTANVALQHVNTGNTITVSARDKAGNLSTATRQVYLNRAPRLTRVPSLSYITVGHVYRDTVRAVDDDGDPLVFSILIQARTGSSIVGTDGNGVFQWTPQAGDTGLTNITVQVSDGYPRVVDSIYSVLVQTSAAVVVAHFLHLPANKFPDTALVADRDTLAVELLIDKPLDAGNFLFSVRVREKNQRQWLMQNVRDTALRWIPTISDTGQDTFEVVVASSADSSDTIRPMPVVRVVKPFVPVEISFATDQSTDPEHVGTHNISVVLSRSDTATVSVQYRIGSGGTADSSTDYRLPASRRVTFLPGSTSAQIGVYYIDDTIVEPNEKGILNLVYPGPSGVAVLKSPTTHTFWILNDDTVRTIDTAWFPLTGGSGSEGGPTVRVPIRVKPASKQVQLSIALGGTATSGLDYVMLSPTDLTVPTGLRDTAVYLRIVDDTVCEWLNETIDLTLTARTPGVVVTSGFYRFTILPSDTTCPKPVLMVYSATGPTPIEKAVMDTARQMGYQVVGMREDQVGSLSYAPYSVVVVSGQVRTAGIGDILRSAAVPVLTASLANAYSLGLTLASQLDTGRAIASSVDVSISDPVLPGGVLQGSVRIAENLSLIPWAHPAAGAVVLGRIPSIGGVIQSLPEGAPPVGRDTSMAAIYRFETGSNLSNTARRCAFPMCSATNGTAGEPVYTQGWWDLLKYCIWWTATGAIR